MSRFPPPAVTTLKITQGDTLTVKRRLNAGESRAAFARMSTIDDDGIPHVSQLQMGLALMVAYLVDWSLVDDHGQQVVIRDQPADVVTAALDALDTDSFAEIQTAIRAHDLNVLQERALEKKELDGAIESSAISPSPAAVTGDTNGSPNLTPTSMTS